jgi:hypothetical protein
MWVDSTVRETDLDADAGEVDHGGLADPDLTIAEPPASREQWPPVSHDCFRRSDAAEPAIACRRRRRPPRRRRTSPLAPERSSSASLADDRNAREPIARFSPCRRVVCAWTPAIR